MGRYPGEKIRIKLGSKWDLRFFPIVADLFINNVSLYRDNGNIGKRPRIKED